MKNINIIASLALVLMTGCQTKGVITLQPNDVLFENITLIPMTSNKVYSNKKIIVRDGKIYKILSDERLINSDAINTIDGTGKFLAPGLVDMHAHIPLPTPKNDNAQEALFLYLANGVTTIRIMEGFAKHLDIREKIREGKTLGPRIFLSGPTFNKNSAVSIDTIDSMVRAQKNAGYDFLKIRPGVERAYFDHLIEMANEINMPFSGHVPATVGIHHALKSKYASIEHLDGFITGMANDVLPNSNNGYFGFNRIDAIDISMLDELVIQTITNNVWNTPTQALLERWCSSDSSETLSAAPEMKYVAKNRLQNWATRRDREHQQSDVTIEKCLHFIQTRRHIIKALNDHGQGVLAGTDPPQIFIVPGFSIHQEMKALLNAGLTTYDAIKTATVNPAIFFNKSHEFGQLIEGASADLVLLAKNPLENIENYTSIQGVMYQGKWLDKTSIANGLMSIENKYKHLITAPLTSKPQHIH